MKNKPKIVLASSSPFRKHLLQKIYTTFEQAAPDINESRLVGETSTDLSKRLALEKATALAEQFPNHLIIGSDQVAMLGDNQLTKPGSHENCVTQLSLSSGKTITFFTSVCVLNSKSRESTVDIEVCKVHMRSLQLKEIENYVERDKPYDCSAAFKSEGLGIALFKQIDSDDPNALIGLPLIKLTALLKDMGLDVL